MNAQSTLEKPATVERRAQPPLSSSDLLDAKSWRCFHCDEVFTDPKEAVTHFGGTQGAQAVCTIKADEIRHMEWCLRRYRDEDTDLHRQIAHMQTEHTQALMRAEESGYAKGLADGRALASNAAAERPGATTPKP